MAREVKAAGILKTLNYWKEQLSYIALENENGEYFRKEVADTLIDGETLVLNAYLETSEGNDDNIRVIDVFGWEATDTLGSGTHFSENDVVADKDSGYTLTLSAEITIENIL